MEAGADVNLRNAQGLAPLNLIECVALASRAWLGALPRSLPRCHGVVLLWTASIANASQDNTIEHVLARTLVAAGTNLDMSMQLALAGAPTPAEREAVETFYKLLRHHQESTNPNRLARATETTRRRALNATRSRVPLPHTIP